MEGSAEQSGGRRPRPQYGEYADEANEFHPTHDPARNPEDPAAAPALPPQRPAAAGATPVPGVPHNLGVSNPPTSSTSPAPAPAAAPAKGTPYVADPPPGHRAAPHQSQPAPQAHEPYPQQAYSQQQPGRSTAAPRSTDRVITILLLALGTVGAFYLGLVLLQLPSQFRLAASMLGVEDLAVPSAVGTIGTIGGLTILTVYAVSLIWSVQRLRRRKLSFWIPLAAGALAFVVYLAFFMIAFAQTPELLQAMSQPDALQKMLDSAANQ